MSFIIHRPRLAPDSSDKYKPVEKKKKKNPSCFVLFFRAITGFNYQKRCNICMIKVVIITDLGQRQKSAQNAEKTTDLPKILQKSSLCCFS